MTTKGNFFMIDLNYPSSAALAKRNEHRDAVGKGERDRNVALFGVFSVGRAAGILPA
jgi:hypothetical protein